MNFLTPEKARLLSIPTKFPDRKVFFNKGRVNTLKKVLGTFDLVGKVNTDDPRVNFEWNNRVWAQPYDYAPFGPISPWHIDDHYSDSGNEADLLIVNSDFTAAVELAIKFLVTNDTAAGDAAIRILDAWSHLSVFNTNAGSTLNWNNHWPLMIQAALMLRGNHVGYTDALHDRLKTVTTHGDTLSTAIGHDDNWAAWGVCYEFAASILLQDRVRFDNAVQRWRTVFDYAVKNNVPVFEVRREGDGDGDGSFGLWYSNFFIYGMTVAAEWARYGGEWLYDYKGTDGSTFKGLALNIRHWTRFPALFPYNTSGTPSETVRILAHDDILHALWPTDESQWLLDNFPLGSVRDVYGMRSAVLCYRYRPLFG